MSEICGRKYCVLRLKTTSNRLPADVDGLNYLLWVDSPLGTCLLFSGKCTSLPVDRAVPQPGDRGSDQTSTTRREDAKSMQAGTSRKEDRDRDR